EVPRPARPARGAGAQVELLAGAALRLRVLGDDLPADAAGSQRQARPEPRAREEPRPLRVRDRPGSDGPRAGEDPDPGALPERPGRRPRVLREEARLGAELRRERGRDDGIRLREG